jgi:hypothetical protein
VRRHLWLNLLWACVLLSPLLFQLAVFPQNPDGAEMLNTALYGGVLHPSGMPLQAWINRGAVAVSPFSPGWTLSFVSWLGQLGAMFLLLQLLGALQVSKVVQAFTVSAFAYLPVMWRLALQPEKYTWLGLTLMLALYAFWVTLKEGHRHGLFCSAAAGAFAVAQHSAALILLPGLMATQAFHLRRRGSDWPLTLGAWVLFALLTAGFYLSLLALRPSEGVAWVDWGHLHSALDVWRHFRRADYAVTSLHHQTETGSTLNGLEMAARALRVFPFGIAMLGVGSYALFARHRAYALVISLTFAGALVVLRLAELPADDLQGALGYGERYPLLVWPMAVILIGLGLEWTLTQLPRLRIPCLTAAFLNVGFLVVSGWPAAQAVNNNLIELFRREVVRELPVERVLFSSHDYELFYGFPCSDRPCYPLKNMFAYDWYRRDVAPALAPEVRPILNSLGVGWPVADFFRVVLSRDLTLASTSATSMLKDPDLMKSAEQIGVVWVFRAGPQQLYSERIVQNSLAICRSLGEAWTGVPEEDGNYFAREVLQNFRFAIQGAADYLNATARTGPGGKADELAKALKPGIDPPVWERLCRAYQISL